LNQMKKALGLAELLTNPSYRVEILLLIAAYLATQPDRVLESQQLFGRVFDITSTIADSSEQAWALRELGAALTQAQRWDQAERVSAAIERSNTPRADGGEQGKALREAEESVPE